MKKKTKYLYLVIAFLALAMLAFSLIAPFCLGSKQKWKWLESEKWGFKVKYPADWKEVLVRDDYAFQALFNSKKVEKENILFTARKGQVSLERDVEEFVQSIEQKEYGDEELLSVEYTTLDGIKAAVVVFLNNDEKVIIEDVIAKREGISYLLRFDYRPNQRPADLIQEVKDSWRWI
jgi:hypothetical protein